MAIVGESTIVAAQPGRQVRLNLAVRYSRATAWCPSKLALAARKPLTISVGPQPGPGATGTITTPCWAWPPGGVLSCTLPLVGNAAQAVAATPTMSAPGAASQRRLRMRVPTPAPEPGSRCRQLERGARQADTQCATRGRPCRARAAHGGPTAPLPPPW